jgi:hypothetical protein
MQQEEAVAGRADRALNDAHHWTRERIAAWVTDPDVPQDESHAHH